MLKIKIKVMEDFRIVLNLHIWFMLENVCIVQDLGIFTGFEFREFRGFETAIDSISWGQAGTTIEISFYHKFNLNVTKVVEHFRCFCDNRFNVNGDLNLRNNRKSIEYCKKLTFHRNSKTNQKIYFQEFN